MSLKKKDFIEIEFTGKLKDGGIFDSNIKKDIETAKLNVEPKPFVFCLGEAMFLKGVEDFLIGKEIGKYTIELSPEKAFGKRESKLVQMIPMKVFQQHKINPIPGIMFNFDNKIAKVLTVSGGRVMVDFNNPLAGKDIIYDIKVLRKVEDTNEKIKAFNEFLFRKDFKFEIKEKTLTISVDKGFKPLVGMFKEKFKEIFELELEVREVEEKNDKKK